MDENGQKAALKINQQDGMDMSFDTNELNVVVKAGASFQVQKSRTIMLLKEMMGMSPLFAQFIAEKGLNFVLDNMEGKGIEELKKLVDGWMKEMQQQKQMAMQQQQAEMQNNPLVQKNQMAAQKLQLDAAKNQQKFMIDMQKLQQDEKKLLADVQMSHNANMIQALKANAEIFSKKVDLQLRGHDQHLKTHDQRHRHLKEAIETHHMVNQPNKEITKESRA
jgi:hypothetical protein